MPKETRTRQRNHRPATPDDDPAGTEIKVTAQEWRRNQGVLLPRAAFGGKRIVVTHRGRVYGAFIGAEELEQLRATKPAATKLSA